MTPYAPRRPHYLLLSNVFRDAELESVRTMSANRGYDGRGKNAFTEPHVTFFYILAGLSRDGEGMRPYPYARASIESIRRGVSKQALNTATALHQPAIGQCYAWLFNGKSWRDGVRGFPGAF